MEYLLANFYLTIFYAFVIWGIIGPLYRVNSIGKRRIFIIIIFSQFLFYYTFRSYFSDIVSYGVSFYDLENVSLFKIFNMHLMAGNIEPGYRLFMWLLSYTTGSYRLFLAINGFVILYCYFKIFCCYSPYVFVSILLFLLVIFNPSLYILRQHISMAVLLLSYPYIINGNFKKFLIVCIIALSFHHSALFFIPVYFLYQIKRIKKYLLVILISTIAMVIFVKGMMIILASYIERYSKFLDESNQFYGGMNWTYAIIMASVLFIYIYVLRKQVFKEGANKLFLSLLCIGTGVAIACAGTPVPSRTILCYYIAAFWTIPLSMKYIKTKLYRYLLFLISLSLYYYIAFVSEIDIVMDYYLDFS